jgi:hypothetical protein
MRIWGIDLGTTSIGFAVVDHDPIHSTGNIHRLGVRIFPEGVTEEKKEPRNKQRRTKRLMRRGIRRRKLRRRLLNEALAASGLLPRYGTAEWNTVAALDPYALRRDGLTRALLPHELGRALYHLAKRRGFAGRATEEKKIDPDEMAATEDAQRLAAEKADRTLGAFLAEQPKKRGRHHTRDMVRDEFDRLWTAQKPHHAVLSEPQFEARIRNLVFFQRPTFWRLKTLSKCQFCPDDAPEPKGSWAGQQFLVLEQLTKLRTAGANSRPLSPEEFKILLEQAHRQRTISWGGVRKALKKHWRERDEDEFQRFNMEVSGAETGIKGHAVEYELRKIFGDAWDSHPKRDEIRRELHQHLWTADYLQVGNSRVEIRREDDARLKRREAREWMKQNWTLTKTLCRTDINILKGNRTPHQVWGNDAEAWHRLKQTISECKLPEYKVRRFMKADIAGADGIDEAGTDTFSERQLADTGWAAREARDFLKRLWPDDGRIVPVETVNGRITAQLRHQWGLNAILNPDGETKTRADHRHHAVDALAVALTSRSFVKRLSDWHKQRETGTRPPEFREPWAKFFEQAKSKTAEIVVSHKTRRKVSGALHAETIVGDTGLQEKTKSGEYRQFVTKKAVERLSKSEIQGIRDPVVRGIVFRHVAERGGDPKKAFPPYPRLPGSNGADGPEIKKARLLIKQQLGLMVHAGTGYADAAANHHIAAYRKFDGSIASEIVSLHEAARRISARKPIVNRNGHHDAKFVMSLAPGDVIEFPKDHDHAGMRVVTSVWSSGVVVTEAINDAEGHPWRPSIGSIVSAGAQKVSVDPIGRIRPARD